MRKILFSLRQSVSHASAKPCFNQFSSLPFIVWLLKIIRPPRGQIADHARFDINFFLRFSHTILSKYRRYYTPFPRRTQTLVLSATVYCSWRPQSIATFDRLNVTHEQIPTFTLSGPRLVFQAATFCAPFAMAHHATTARSEVK